MREAYFQVGVIFCNTFFPSHPFDGQDIQIKFLIYYFSDLSRDTVHCTKEAVRVNLGPCSVI